MATKKTAAPKAAKRSPKKAATKKTVKAAKRSPKKAATKKTVKKAKK